MNVVKAKDFEAFSHFFKGEKGHRRAEFIMRLLSIDQVNRLHKDYGSFTGPAFTSRILDDIGVKYVIGNAERLGSLPEGSFITVSNHPYGHLDGIISIDLLGSLRPDYRFMVNTILSNIRALRGSFISVTPTGNKKTAVTAASISGIRETLAHVKKGHPIGFFPSGAVSDFSLKDMRVRDRKWQSSILQMIYRLKVPILPLCFFDKNSPIFYFLGLVNWRVRLLRLPSEVFNKKGRELRLGVGKIIPVKEQERFNNAEELGVFLRKAVYEMPLPGTFLQGKEVAEAHQKKKAIKSRHNINKNEITQAR